MPFRQIDDQTTPMKDGEVQLLRAFIALQIVGGILICATLLTALFSRKIHRQPTWISFCVSWIILCLSYTMLTWIGQQTGYRPHHVPCLIQASLAYGALALVGFTTVSLIAELWFNLSGILKGGEDNQKSRWRDFLLIAVPYLIWFTVSMIAIIIGTKYPDSVGLEFRRLYCHITVEVPWRTTASLVFLSLIILLVLEGMIFFTLFKNYGGLGAHTNIVKTFLRSLLFTLYGIFIAAATSVTINDRTSPLSDLSIGITPMIVFLLFGTQKDILLAWMFWKRKGTEPSVASTFGVRNRPAKQGSLLSDAGDSIYAESVRKKTLVGEA